MQLDWTNCFDSLRHKDSTQPTQPLRTYLSKKKKGDFVGDKGQAHDLASCSIFELNLGRGKLRDICAAMIWICTHPCLTPKRAERRSFLFFSYSVAIGLSHGYLSEDQV